jgi:hypothetical protein
MAERDFRRIGELFYPDIGSGQAQTTLAGFISDAFTAYLQHLPASGQPRQVRYPAVDGEGSLAFTVALARGRPDLFAACMEGETNDLPALLGRLRGTLTAAYRGLKINEIAEPARNAITPLAERRRDDYAQAGPLGLYFLHGQPVIRQAVLQRQAGAARTPVPLEQGALDDIAHCLLGAADAISIANTYYPDGRSTGELIRESCSITRPVPGRHRWSYRTQAATGSSLPACSLPLMECLYEESRGQFGPLSFRRRSFAAGDGMG